MEDGLALIKIFCRSQLKPFSFWAGKFIVHCERSASNDCNIKIGLHILYIADHSSNVTVTTSAKSLWLKQTKTKFFAIFFFIVFPDIILTQTDGKKMDQNKTNFKY